MQCNRYPSCSFWTAVPGMLGEVVPTTVAPEGAENDVARHEDELPTEADALTVRDALPEEAGDDS